MFSTWCILQTTMVPPASA